MIVLFNSYVFYEELISAMLLQTLPKEYQRWYNAISYSCQQKVTWDLNIRHNASSFQTKDIASRGRGDTRHEGGGHQRRQRRQEGATHLAWLALWCKDHREGIKRHLLLPVCGFVVVEMHDTALPLQREGNKEAYPLCEIVH